MVRGQLDSSYHLRPFTLYLFQGDVAKAKVLSEKYNIPLHIHVAETRKEVEDITAQTGMAPAEYLYSIGLLDRNVIAAHSVWLNPKEIELYARTRTSVAHCPKSNLKLASGIADTDTYT